MKKSTILGAVFLWLWALPTDASPIGFEVFHDKASYTSVLLQQGRITLDSDWNEAVQTEIHQGQAFGIFSFQFDPAVVQPVVGVGIVSGLAVGAEPDGRLKGDQGLSLIVTPGLALTAFGTEIVVAPFDNAVSGNIFRLIVGCDDDFGPCAVVGNLPDLNPHGGGFFLGVIAGPGVAFDRITIEAVTPRDDAGRVIGFVPEWQIASVTSSQIPESSTLALMAAGLACFSRIRRRQHDQSE